LACGAALAACSGSTDQSQVGGGAASSTGASAGTANIITPNGDGGAGNGTGMGTGGSGTPGPYMLPADFTKADKGGFKLGPAISGTGSAGSGAGGDTASGCGTQILGVVRDFKGNNEPGGHPDFEHYAGADASLGIVKDALGSDQKPVYSASGPFIDTSVNGDAANGQQTTSKADFDQWYRNTQNVNKPYVIYFYFEPNAGVLTFESTAFFPLDGAGWGNGPNNHNFGFTTEVHTRFTYKGGETFAFTGDDDLWVFINHKLAIDLGGLHSKTSKQISLDAQAKALGIAVGSTYDLDLFHAERHTSASNFRVDTNLEFTNCGTIVPDVPVK
jgi:fibro-slime domain-containing protein